MRPKNISKEATVAQYIDEFLKDRPRTKRDEFRKRPIARQYASIIQWKHVKRREENAVKEGAQVVEAIDGVRAMLSEPISISEANFEAALASLDALREELHRFMGEQKERRIEALEAKSREINAQIEALRNR